MIKKILIVILLNCFFSNTIFSQKDNGFRGIWYAIGKTNNEYVHKYSGGLSTYPSNHYPFSIYSPKVQKTFFCYGGSSKDSIPSLLHEIAYFDHKTKKVSRPTIVLDKQTNDAHDNPVLSIDNEGFIWLFSTSHGIERPSFIHKSTLPYDISAFKKIESTRLENGKVVSFDNFSYLQIYNQGADGFFGLMTHYDKNVLKYGASKPRRTIGFVTSKNGVEWSEIKDIAKIQEGHYQTSGINGKTIGTAFNFHPDTEKGAGLDYRTNLYFLSTSDVGKTWQTANKQTVNLPFETIQNPALVRDYQKEKLNVYINDVAFDAKNQPIILYITSKGPEPGPQNAPYAWWIAHFSQNQWQFSEITQSDHNYDMGSLYVEGDSWRIIAPTQNSPQAFNTGGEIIVWESNNQGKTWKKVKELTKNSQYNHSYPRKPIQAHPDFYAFWADGHPRKPSPSSLYFANKKGEVYKLPETMNQEFQNPILIKK